MKKRKENANTVIDAGLAGAGEDTVSRYGSGLKEHLVAYTGIDHEYRTPKNEPTVLDRSLKKIAGYKRPPKSDPNYDTTLKQQAGFSAEVKEVARRRAQEAINGKKPTTVRTDDIAKRKNDQLSRNQAKHRIETDGIPKRYNDQLYDIAKVDANGDPVPGTCLQMKFVGSSPKAAVDRLMSSKFQKYIDNNVKTLVPSDYYDGMKGELEYRIKECEKQIEHLRKTGVSKDALAKREAQLKKYKTIDKNLRKSKVSNNEAVEAAKNPYLSTLKDVMKTANKAGLEQAKMGAAIGGGISLVRNFIDYCNDKKTAEEAALSIVGDTASIASVSYVTGAGGSLLKGTMQNAKNSVLRNISKTNLPAYIATATVEISKTLYAYFNKEIDGTECLEQLGEKGYGMVNSALYAAIGQALIPIPVVGALAGGMLGYALSSASYNVLLGSLKAQKLAKEERNRIEKECKQAISMIREYRAKLEESINKYLYEQSELFKNSFDKIKEALEIGDVDEYISGANQITEAMGKQPLYQNMDEFNELMNSTEAIVI